MNSAQGFLVQLAKYSKTHRGLICQTDLNWVVEEIKNLISPKSEEIKSIKSIKSAKFQKSIETQALEIETLLRVYANYHK